MNRISVIMYHYVRDLKYSRYPKIRGLPRFDCNDFPPITINYLRY